MSLQNIYSRIQPELYQKLATLAEIRNQSVSQLVRGIVIAFFESVNEVTDEVITSDSQAQLQGEKYIERTYSSLNLTEHRSPKVTAVRIHESEGLGCFVEEFAINDAEVELDW